MAGDTGTPEPGFIDRVIKLLRNTSGGKKDPNDVADVLPESVMPRQAVRKHKSRLEELDENAAKPDRAVKAPAPK